MFKQSRFGYLLGLFGFLSLFATPLRAQIASPSLDLSFPTAAPAAAGWRTQMAVFGGYQEGTGQRRAQNIDVFEYSSVKSDVGFTVPVWNAVLEASAANFTQKTNVSASPGTVPLQGSTNQLRLAMGDQDWASVGVGVREIRQTDFFDVANPKLQRTQSTIDGSVSFRFAESIYLGLGGSKVRQRSPLFVDLVYKETFGGIGLVLGTPGETQFRFETGSRKSPTIEAVATTTKGAAWHSAERSKYAEVELLIRGLLFSGRLQELTKKSVSITPNPPSPSEYKETVSESGVMWIPKEGMMLGFYFVNYKAAEAFEDTNSLFQVRTGFVF